MASSKPDRIWSYLCRGSGFRKNTEAKCVQHFTTPVNRKAERQTDAGGCKLGKPLSGLVLRCSLKLGVSGF